MSVLRVEDLSISFGGLQALHKLNLVVEEGERRAVIGPNGAGKTTFFNLISGILSPTSGRIHLSGKDITGTPPHQRARLGLARTFQITSLFPSLSVQENVFLAVLAHSQGRLRMLRTVTPSGPLFDRARELLETWDFWGRRATVVRTLSYGEQRQIEVLMGLAGAPKLLLLDEPTGGMSEAETQAMCRMIQNLSRDVTVMFIEHDMNVALGLADRVTVLSDGCVLMEGTPDEIKGHPKIMEVYLGAQAD